MFHFDQIKPWHVDELLTMLTISLVFFGLPALMLFGALGFFWRRLRTRHVRSLLPLVGLVFGLAAGYFAVWADHCWYRFSPQNFHWTEPLAVFGAPGDAMANSYGGDWQDDEAWDYRGDITVLNGLFWMGLGTASMLVVLLVARALGPNPQVSNPLPAANSRLPTCFRRL
jgi:hypothetical protein